MAETYCLDEMQWKQASAPIKPSTYIGPHKDCKRDKENFPSQNINQQPQSIGHDPQTSYIHPYLPY